MKVLAVIDMQNDFTTGVLGNEQTKAVSERVAEKIRKFRTEEEKSLIIATYDTHNENYMNTQEGKNLPVPHCIKGTEGWELDSAVKNALGENYVKLEKITFGAIDFPEIIKNYAGNEPIDEIQLMGVCTDICVISNAMLLKATFPETPVKVIADCCAGVTPDSHNNALNAMKACQIIIEE